MAAAKKKPVTRALTSPPPGTYDPAIDAQVGQANRGLDDYLSDYTRDYGEPGTALGGRAGEDYGVSQAGIQRDLGYGLADINTSSGRSLADLLTSSGRQSEDITRSSGRQSDDINTSSGRSLTDLLTSRSRAGEDYGTATQGVQRNFAQLGAAQTQSARAAGVQRGGALAQALAKRQANQAIAQQPLDTNFSRFNADSTLAQGRLGEDTSTSLGRLGEDTSTSLGRLGQDTTLGQSRIGEDQSTATSRLQAGALTDQQALDRGYLRSTDDAGTALARAQRENSQFGTDASAQRLYQANTPLPLPSAAAAAPKRKKTANGLILGGLISG